MITPIRSILKSLKEIITLLDEVYREDKDLLIFHRKEISVVLETERLLVEFIKFHKEIYVKNILINKCPKGEVENAIKSIYKYEYIEPEGLNYKTLAEFYGVLRYNYNVIRVVVLGLNDLGRLYNLNIN